MTYIDELIKKLQEKGASVDNPKRDYTRLNRNKEYKCKGKRFKK